MLNYVGLSVVLFIRLILIVTKFPLPFIIKLKKTVPFETVSPYTFTNISPGSLQLDKLKKTACLQ